MATIRKRQGRYQAQVRRKGQPLVTRTFASKESAKKWIKAVETDMERGEFKSWVNTAVDQLIKRYQTDVVPNQKLTNQPWYAVEDWRFHDLRHEATSRLFERGFNVMEVALVTGHQDLRMLKRYTHLKPESLVARLG